MKNVVVTGSSLGIGRATVEEFLKHPEFVVHGIDVLPATIEYPNYVHHIADVACSPLPNIENPYILINNAGVQNSGRDIDVNLKGLMTCTAKYALHNPAIAAVVNLASVSAHNGAEFPEYTASKGGVVAYTKWTAKQIAKYGATCNSLSFGGVETELNTPVMNDADKWADIMSMTPLKKWATADEAATWIYFVSVTNKSMSGQDIIIDNLETLNHRFVW